MRPFQRGWGTNELPSLCWPVTAINPPPPNPGGRPQPGVRRVRRLPMRGHPRADPHWRDPAQERLSIEKVRFSVGRTQPVFEQRRFVRGPGSLDRGSTPAAWKTADAPYSKIVPPFGHRPPWGEGSGGCRLAGDDPQRCERVRQRPRPPSVRMRPTSPSTPIGAYTYDIAFDLHRFARVRGCHPPPSAPSLKGLSTLAPGCRCEAAATWGSAPHLPSTL